MIRIVSHHRTGTHLLAKLLHQNFYGQGADYEGLHYSHTRIPEGPFVHIYRAVYPVMLSVWRMREHFGVHPSVDFSRMIRTRWPDMPKVESKYAFRDFDGTMLDRWLRNTTDFSRKASISVSYNDVIDRPLNVVLRVSAALNFPRRGFSPVSEHVGWRGSDEKPEVTANDAAMMEEYQGKLIVKLGG